MNYKKTLLKIYGSDIGAIWKIPNKVWTTNFANNKEPNDLHPGIVEKRNADNISVSIVPGTSRYKKGRCVYKVDLSDNKKYSFFLLYLSMPYVIEDLFDLEPGWDGVFYLSKQQLEKFILQIRKCKEWVK